MKSTDAEYKEEDMKFLLMLGALTTLRLVAAETIPSDAERILASEKPAKHIFTSDRWIPAYPSRLKVIPGGKDNAAVTLLFNNSHGGLNKSMFPYIYGNNPLLNTVTLPLNLPPEKFTEFNQLSCQIYPDVPDRAAIWFEMGGSGIWTQACRPLKPRRWNKVSVCWSNHTPEQAAKIRTAVFSRQTFGRLPGDPEWSRYCIKDLTLEKVVTGTEYTWDVSPEKIVLPQTGFSPGYTKKALLASSHTAESFTVEKDGRTVFRGKLRLEQHPTGSFKTADFSSLKTPGVYRVKSGSLISVPFEISNSHLNDLARKNAYFLLCMRSGMATPAHPACFLDDCIRSDNREPVDVSGGWFDASDLRGYHSMAMKTILRPLALASEFNVPALYNEALWGATHLDKLFDKETGLPYTVHSLYPRNNPDKRMARLYSDGNFYKVNNYWTDNKPGTGDERVIHVARNTYICHPDLMDSHWGMTAAGIYFHLAAEKQERKLAESVLKKCKRHFDYLCDRSAEELRKDGIGYYNPQVNTALALRLENAAALWRATGGTYYRELAFELAKTLLARQQRSLFKTPHGYLSGFFCTSDRKNISALNRDDMSIYAMSRLAAEFPEEKLSLKIHAALRIHADFYLKNPASRALPYSFPYPVLTEKPDGKSFHAEIGVSTGNGRKIYGMIPKTFLSGITGTAAFQTQALGIFLNDPQLQEIASSCLNFHTGENPCGRSFIADVGTNYRGDIMSSALGWIPGMMSNPEIRNGIPSLPYNRHYGLNEIYTQTQAGYAVAASVINAPARITLRLKNQPGEITLKIHDLTSGKEARAFHNLSGDVPMELPGGTRYRFEFSNGLVFHENILSGEIRDIPVDMACFLRILKVEAPREVKAGEAFPAEVEVYYFGSAPCRAVINARGENLKLQNHSAAQELQSGQTAVFRFSGKTQNAGMPFVFMAFPEPPRQALRSASGASL